MRNLIRTVFGMVSIVLAAYSGSTKEVAPVEARVLDIPVAEVSPWYLGVGVAQIDFLKDPCSPLDPTCKYEDVTNGFMVRGGYDFNPYFGIEARAARTFWDKGPFGGVPIEHGGLFFKPQYPMSERVNCYSLVGAGYTKNRGNGARIGYFDNDIGLSAGVGVEIDLSDTRGDFIKDAVYKRQFDGYADQGKGWVLFADYQRLLIKADRPDIDMFSFGLRYDF